MAGIVSCPPALFFSVYLGDMHALPLHRLPPDRGPREGMAVVPLLSGSGVQHQEVAHGRAPERPRLEDSSSAAEYPLLPLAHFSIVAGLN